MLPGACLVVSRACLVVSDACLEVSGGHMYYMSTKRDVGTLPPGSSVFLIFSEFWSLSVQCSRSVASFSGVTE